MFLTAKMVPNLMTKSRDQKFVLWKTGNNLQLGPLTCAENDQNRTRLMLYNPADTQMDTHRHRNRL